MMKKIVWRLKESPTSISLQELVKSGILTKEEAREILFNLEEETNRDNESLKSEIKFLRELVEKLSNSRSQIITTIKEIEVPIYRQYPWWKPYENWYNTGSSATSYQSDSNSNFSSIKTF